MFSTTCVSKGDVIAIAIIHRLLWSQQQLSLDENQDFSFQTSYLTEALPIIIFMSLYSNFCGMQYEGYSQVSNTVKP